METGRYCNGGINGALDEHLMMKGEGRSVAHRPLSENLALSDWLAWFLDILLQTLEDALAGIERILAATRHLSDLLAKGCLEKLPGGGRSTRYQVVGSGLPLPGERTGTFKPTGERP